MSYIESMKQQNLKNINKYILRYFTSCLSKGFSPQHTPTHLYTWGSLLRLCWSKVLLARPAHWKKWLGTRTSCWASSSFLNRMHLGGWMMRRDCRLMEARELVSKLSKNILAFYNCSSVSQVGQWFPPYINWKCIFQHYSRVTQCDPHNLDIFAYVKPDSN